MKIIIYGYFSKKRRTREPILTIVLNADDITPDDNGVDDQLQPTNHSDAKMRAAGPRTAGYAVLNN